MKNSNDTIGNRTRKLPACTAVYSPLQGLKISGFVDLEVSVLASGTRVSRVQTPAESVRYFGRKFLSTPSFGGEVKPSVPCRKFTAWKSPLSTKFSEISRP